jgi:hypothetical protein
MTASPQGAFVRTKSGEPTIRIRRPFSVSPASRYCEHNWASLLSRCHRRVLINKRLIAERTVHSVRDDR